MMRHREIPFGRPWITDEDREAVMRVLDGHILTHGPECKELEAEFASFLGDGACCVTVSSGMAALHLACLHFGIGPGDEVIVPAQTHVATVHAVEAVGARPVFVDCEAATGNITADGVSAAITPKTKAVSLVHFVGIPCNMPAIMDVAERNGLKVIEDCALAIGARHGGRHVGLFGDAACFSFYPVKHFTTGEGGMFVTRHSEVAEAVKRLRAFGVDRSHSERSLPGIYDVPGFGLNYRMSELQAALGRSQLRRIGTCLERRRASFAALKNALGDVPCLAVLDTEDTDAKNSHYCMSVVLQGQAAARRDEIAMRLKASGIGTSVYYPHPVPRLHYYTYKYGYNAGIYPEAVRISDHSFALPVAFHVDDEDIAYMAKNLRSVLEEIDG